MLIQEVDVTCKSGDINLLAWLSFITRPLSPSLGWFASIHLCLDCVAGGPYEQVHWRHGPTCRKSEEAVWAWALRIGGHKVSHRALLFLCSRETLIPLLQHDSCSLFRVSENYCKTTKSWYQMVRLLKKLRKDLEHVAYTIKNYWLSL